MTFSLQPAPSVSPFAQLRQKLVPLTGIVVVHALMFLLIYSGMAHRIVQKAMPDTVYVNFVDPPAPSKPAAPAPVPKNVALAEAPPPVIPPLPLINLAAVQNAITTPPPAAVAAPVERQAAPAQAAIAPPAAPKPSGPRTVSSGVEPISTAQPTYPPLSKRMGEQGKVVLRILVNEKGVPDKVLVESSSGFARLDAAGREAALRYLFKPYIEDGHAVAVFVLLPLSFELNS
ncbi:energy transducer TonB [Massilia glaciei]|uniref:Energy transducer TonB n=2 Tax=Massilia glaciei TaxID=1524097 RepID=A0A2U2HH93_9BURK|nr:energy transducer TonB [Massilia glaciei]